MCTENSIHGSITIKVFLFSCLVIWLTVSCSSNPAPGPANEEPFLLQGVETGLNIHGRTPRLHRLNRGFLLSWVEPGDHRNSLKYMTFKNGQWSDQRTAAQGENWMVNYADIATVTPLSDQHFVASWLETIAGKRSSYRFMLSQSLDEGHHWSSPVSPIDSQQKGEHGFVTMQAHSPQSVMVGWISEKDGIHSINSTQLDHEGLLAGADLVDESVCSCCQPDLERQGERLLLAYRDRSRSEIRDIALAAYQQERWQSLGLVHPDGWKLNGCPVNGPSLTTTETGHLVLWFSAAQDQPMIRYSLTNRNGVAQGILDRDDVIGYVHGDMIDASRALMLWLSQPAHRQQINLQLINLHDGSKSRHLLQTMPETVVGFPSLVSYQQRAYIVFESSDQTISLYSLPLYLLDSSGQAG